MPASKLWHARGAQFLLLVMFGGTTQGAEHNASMTIGTGYDSNPSLLSEDARGSGLWLIQPTVGIHSESYGDAGWEIRGGYAFQQTTLDSHSVPLKSTPGVEFRVDTPQTRQTWLEFGTTSPRGRDLMLGAVASLIHNTDASNDANDYISMGLTPEVRFRTSFYDRFAIRLMLQRTDFHKRSLSPVNPASQVDELIGVRLRWWHRLPGNIAAEAIAGYSALDSNEDTFDSMTTLCGGRLWYVFNRSYRLVTSVLYGLEQFESFVSAGTQRARDTNLRITSEISYRVSKQLRFAITLTHSERDSNEVGLDYTRTASYFTTTLSLL